MRRTDGRSSAHDIGLLGQYVFNGLMLGMMYAMVAVGFTLFFGVLDVIKFSHGDVLDGRRLHRTSPPISASTPIGVTRPLAAARSS